MPLLLSDFPPYARPPQDRLGELEHGLVALLFMLEKRPGSPQPLGGQFGGAWWRIIVVYLGWQVGEFVDVCHRLRGGGFMGWAEGPNGLTRKGIREALALRREGVAPWRCCAARPTR